MREMKPGRRQDFLDMWKILPSLYTRVRLALRERGKATRACFTGKLSSGLRKMRWRSWEGRIIVAGFNALNGCEKRIFQWLQRHGAEFFWDFDHSYTDDADQ